MSKQKCPKCESKKVKKMVKEGRNAMIAESSG
jgi:ssDNA-binding Zn-finger/Zn-ribbon topoisomerase 1